MPHRRPADFQGEMEEEKRKAQTVHGFPQLFLDGKPTNAKIGTCRYCSECYDPTSNPKGSCVKAPDRIKRTIETVTCVGCAGCIQYHCSNEDDNGVNQRNTALEWIRKNVESGILYFADDDNTYDVEVFHEMRPTQRVSVWPVGLVGGLLVESPIIDNGKIVGFNSMWNAKRPFPIDMAGFAVNINHWMNYPNSKFQNDAPVSF
ncbi:unnamed protein product [Cyprideis torosa]|uniref:Galactosylgalactosylxylosylprotein 3-beta-glucuronosyltransferase n=1 Tax=Cyprideis torosa TaxID=163714 RepID=A0A7R8ZMX1_9CRUS|nr:unnamed protein product [Cyprideis torosa]CAG0886563.1 unnamed protein product [Cyprideis torosa]